MLKDKGNNHVPPNHRTRHPNYLLDSPPSLTMNPWGWTWKIFSSYMSHSSNSFPFPHTQAMFITESKSKVCFPSILGCVLPPLICYLSFAQVFSLPQNFRSSLNPWFSRPVNGKITDFLRVIIIPEVVPTCSPLMESWWAKFNMVVPLVHLQST